MSKKQKKTLIRIIVVLILFIIVFIIDHLIHLDQVITDFELAWLLPFSIYIVLYLGIAYDVLWKAIRNILHGQVFDENFLMCVATIGAFAVSSFEEAVAVILFYQVGEFFQSYAVGKSRKSISDLMDIRPDSANVLREGSYETVDPDEVAVGDIILVNPGERIALDGIIVKGNSNLDTKALTGEALPREVKEGSEVLSGCINLTQSIEIEVTKEFYDSTVSKILDLVENASSQKSKAENFITKFAKYYTPTVVILALLLAIIPGAITGAWNDWIYRALNFLVVSCPCALVISIPLSFFAGIGAASRYGILIKGSNYLEKLNKANIFVFDKTGTLTKGNFAVTEVKPSIKRAEILRLAAIAESKSNHPIALSIKQAYSAADLEDYALEDISGYGIIARGKDTIYCGNAKLMHKENIEFPEETVVGTIVYVAKNKEYVGSIIINDELKANAATALAKLHDLGSKTIMLTGDNEEVAKNVAGKLQVTDYKASLLPQDKVQEVENLLNNKGKDDVLCFVGDGINDAPVCSDAAIEASDIVLMYDNLEDISLAKKIAHKIMLIVFENIIFALGVKVAVLILSALGLSNMWLGVFADVGVAILAILNAMRANSKYKQE